ncbi:hypothetical protein FRC03_004960 [Tulasnella sp. 419]|nr:hypothetical protein FRC03_004960 [Tulasnella sp. 419]
MVASDEGLVPRLECGNVVAAGNVLDGIASTEAQDRITIVPSLFIPSMMAGYIAGVDIASSNADQVHKNILTKEQFVVVANLQARTTAELEVFNVELSDAVNHA